MKFKKAVISALLTIPMVISLMAVPTLSATEGQDLKIEDLGVFYGYPSYINGANGNVAQAVEAFKPFEIIVLGDTVENPSHGDYAKSKQIIAQLNTNKNKVFGYVPIGTSCCGYLSTSQIKAKIDNWKVIGATGIFMDEFGFDYKVTRAKQNELVDYAHAKGLNVFANAWVPDDAMGVKNEKGVTENNKLGQGDYFLMEDWIAQQGNLQPSKQWVTKADSALALSMKTGVKIAILATNPNPSVNVTSAQFKLATNATAMYGFDAFQWTEVNHSSNSNNMKTYQLPQSYGTSFIEDAVTHNADYSVMTRKTDKGTFTLKQNGATVSAEFKISDVTTPTPTPTTPIPSPSPSPTPGSDLQKQIDALKAENTQLKSQITTLSNIISAIKEVLAR